MTNFKEIVESSMHGDVGAASNRDFKRQEMEYELRHERKASPPPHRGGFVRKKMTGLLYHEKGDRVDKKGRKYSAHHGTKAQGERDAMEKKGRYVHLGEESIDEISKETYKSYRVKAQANKDHHDAEATKAMQSGDLSKSSEHMRVANKRRVNITKAIFREMVEESHLKKGAVLKKGDEKFVVQKPVGDDKYVVKEDLDATLSDFFYVLTLDEQFGPYDQETAERVAKKHNVYEDATVVSLEKVLISISEADDKAKEKAFSEFEGHKAKAAHHMNKARAEKHGTEKYYTHLYHAHTAAAKACHSVGYKDRAFQHEELADKFLMKSIDKL